MATTAIKEKTANDTWVKEGKVTVKNDDILYVDAKSTNKASNGAKMVTVYFKGSLERSVKCREEELIILQ